ncbi:MAG: putative type modification methyltransferase [Ignavibacteria bacterium]|nr:putative type modification methyltransferase [Ignavibacteria bacterium]
MDSFKILKHEIDELPSKFAERLGIQYSKIGKRDLKKLNGQFFTPIEISTMMGTLSNYVKNSISILDPGCGMSILSCSLIEHLILKRNAKSIELIVYETDNEIYKYLECSLTYLANWLKSNNIDFSYNIILKDFVLENSHVLEDKSTLFNEGIKLFDIIISNPPYFKLPKEDIRTIATKSIVNGHPNIYAMFMAISSRLLKKEGELIFITPRSFASGSYFKLFREKFFNKIEIEKVHVFVSRDRTFKRDKVLQETIIIKGIRKETINQSARVRITSSNNYKDINFEEQKNFKHNEIIDINSKEKILHLPSNDNEENILNMFKKWNGNLKKYDINISTGPVVAFRNKKWIIEESINQLETYVPLFWLHNVKQMALEWPIFKKDKGQFINKTDESLKTLLPNKNYILLRRFSTKDDKQRLIAAPYFCNITESEYIGVENKVNYIYRKYGHLDRNEIVGLCALLNSKLFDTYFRIFNGNVNVSASELREMPFPPYSIIKDIGDRIILSNDYSTEHLNKLIKELLI